MAGTLDCILLSPGCLLFLFSVLLVDVGRKLSYADKLSKKLAVLRIL